VLLLTALTFLIVLHLHHQLVVSLLLRHSRPFTPRATHRRQLKLQETPLTEMNIVFLLTLTLTTLLSTLESLALLLSSLILLTLLSSLTSSLLAIKLLYRDLQHWVE
jgi:hypothetical protein